MDDFRYLIPLFSVIYIFTAFSIVFLNYKKKKIIEILNPVVFYSILWTVPFAIIPLLIYFEIFDISDILTKSNIKYTHILLSQTMAFISLIFLLLGFSYGNKIRFFKRKLKILEDGWSRSGVLITLLIYFVLIIILTKYQYETGGLFHGVENLKEEQSEGGVYGYIATLFGIFKISFFFTGFLPLLSLLAYNRFKNKIFIVMSVFSSILLIGIGLLASQKEVIASVILVIIWYFYYKAKSVTFKKELLIFVFMILFFFTFPIFNLYREYLKTTLEKPDVFKVLSFIEENYDIERIKDNLNYLFLRFDHLNTNLFIVDSDEPPKFGYTYFLGLKAFIAGLPKMPKDESMGVSFNNTFAREYGIISEFNYEAYITLPNFVEVYMNFGFFAIPLFMFLYGILYRKIYNLFEANNLNYVLLGYMLWYLFVFQGTAIAFPSIMFLLGRLLIPTLIILFLLNYKYILKSIVR
ncbi:MAG: O-antigen polymerase [Minisyncoccia bacterium]